MPVPAICQNKSCGLVWFTDSCFVTVPGGTMLLEGCEVGPCPKCGGFGDVPDGVYGAFSAQLLRQDQFEKIIFALSVLHKRMLQGASVKEIREEIKSSPLLSFLSGYIPRNWKDLGSMLAVFAAVYAGIQYLRQTSGISVQENEARVLQAISDALPGPRPAVHNKETSDTPEQDKPNRESSSDCL